MPQMKPMYWLMILMMIFFIMMITISIIYYFKYFLFNLYSTSNKNYLMKNWNWCW